MPDFTSWPCAVAACASPSNEPPSNWSSDYARLCGAALTRMLSSPARGARRSAGKSIRLPAWRACPREFPERSNFSNYAHPVYLSWPRWSHPFCGLQSEAHEGDNRNSASFPGSRTGLVEVTCCRCYIHCACVGTLCISWPFLSAQRLCKTVGNFLFLVLKPVKDLQVEFCQP